MRKPEPGQVSFFGGTTGVELEEPEPVTEVRVSEHSHRSARLPLRKVRREAICKLLEVLKGLEGQTIYVEVDPGSRGHFWLNKLRLDRVKVQTPYWMKRGDEEPPQYYGAPVIILWGNRNASIRIDSARLWNVRTQEYFGYTSYLVDFWNGFAQNPIDQYKPWGYDCLHLVKLKD